MDPNNEEELNYEYTDSESDEEAEPSPFLLQSKPATTDPSEPRKLRRDFPRIPPEPRKGPRKRIIWDVPWKPSGWLKRWRIRAYDYCFLANNNGKKAKPKLPKCVVQMDPERVQLVFKPVSQPLPQPQSKPLCQLESQSLPQPGGGVPVTVDDVVDLTIVFKNDRCTNSIPEQSVMFDAASLQPDWSKDPHLSTKSPFRGWKNQQERPRSNFKKGNSQQLFHGKQFIPHPSPLCKNTWNNQQVTNTSRYFRHQGHHRHFQKNYVN